MPHPQPRVIPVRHGEVTSSGSWLSVWIDTADGAVAYVGATGFDPELRAFLHVTSETPEVGRVRAKITDYALRDFDVMAFPLPADVSRSLAKRMLTAALRDPGESADIDPDAVPAGAASSLIDGILHQVKAHIRSLNGRVD